jgi:hypothetical protein
MTIRSLVFILACGCTGVHTNPVQPDARPDAPEIDAPIDGPTILTTHHYVMDKQIIPTTNTEARNLGLDINNDTVTDNQLGAVIGTLVAQGLDPQPALDTAIDHGTILMLIDFEANGFTTSETRFTLFSGANPQPPACNGGADTVCRHHLAGTGSFAVAATSAHDPLLTGNMVGGTALTNVDPAGHLQIQTSLLTANPITLNLIGARVKVVGPSDPGITSGVIAGAVAQTEIDAKLLPAWQQTFDATMKADCPGAPPSCGCVTGSTGKSFQQLFDTSPRDCTISLNEIKTNSLIVSLLAPDVTIEGNQALSFGFGFTAVKAVFTP